MYFVIAVAKIWDLTTTYSSCHCCFISVYRNVILNTMNLPYNKQYVSFESDGVDVVNKGLIDIDSIQTDIDLFL